MSKPSDVNKCATFYQVDRNVGQDTSSTHRLNGYQTALHMLYPETEDCLTQADTWLPMF